MYHLLHSSRPVLKEVDFVAQCSNNIRGVGIFDKASDALIPDSVQTCLAETLELLKVKQVSVLIVRDGTAPFEPIERVGTRGSQRDHRQRVAGAQQMERIVFSEFIKGFADITNGPDSLPKPIA